MFLLASFSICYIVPDKARQALINHCRIRYNSFFCLANKNLFYIKFSTLTTSVIYRILFHFYQRKSANRLFSAVNFLLKLSIDKFPFCVYSKHVIILIIKQLRIGFHYESKNNWNWKLSPRKSRFK